MNCLNCPSRPAVLERLCSLCIARRVEKRMARAFRKVLGKNDRALLIVNDGTAAGAVLEHLLGRILTHTHHTLHVSTSVHPGFDKVFVPKTRDEFLTASLHSIFSRGVLHPKDKTIALLEGISSKECEIYARSKKLPFSKETRSVYDPLEKLERAIPGTKNSLAKSMRSFRFD